MLSYRPEYVEDYGAGPRHLLRLAIQLRRARAAVLLRPAVPRGRFRIAGGSVDVAPTLARAMGVAPPSSSAGRVLGEALARE